MNRTFLLILFVWLLFIFIHPVHAGKLPDWVKVKPLEPELANPDVKKDSVSGLTIQELTPKIRQSLNIPSKVKGVVINDIEDDSIFFGILLQGDIIEMIDMQKVEGIDDFKRLILKNDRKVLFLIYRNGGYIYVTAKK